MPAPANQRGQLLLAEEYFASENASFIETLRGVSQPKALAAFADRWKKDPRPWARQQILAYLALPLNCPGHQPVTKRLFKHAEAAGDDEKKKKQVEESTRVVNLSDIDRELIIRWLLQDYRVVFGGEPISAAPPR